MSYEDDIRAVNEGAKERLRAKRQTLYGDPVPDTLTGRATSETGGQKGVKPARFGGADAGALQELALVYGWGEREYARFNYLKGYPWSQSIDALFRHLFAFMAGEGRDPDSGRLHTAHVAWHALALTAFQQRGIGTDDREPRSANGFVPQAVEHDDPFIKPERVNDAVSWMMVSDAPLPESWLIRDDKDVRCQCENCKALRREDTTHHGE